MAAHSALAIDPDVPMASADKRWLANHNYLTGLTAKASRSGPLDIYFIGDSLTEFWPSLGKDVWQVEFGKLHVLNGGVSGDLTQNILFRITRGEFEHITPKVVVVLAGINNLGSSPQLKPKDLARGIARIVATARAKSPTSEILLLSIFPCSEPNDPVRARIRETNKRLALLDDKTKVFYLDLYESFLDARGVFSPEISPDGLHLNARGYKIWADGMRPLLQKLLEESASPPAASAK